LHPSTRRARPVVPVPFEHRNATRLLSYPLLRI